MALILLAVVFIGLPLLEIAVFIEVGGAVGLWPTIAATIATALAGSLLLRTQGLAALARARAQMDRGELPAREMFEGVCLVLAGALLLVPGFVTDAIGLLLFVPPLREALRWLIARHLAAKAARGEARIFVDGVEVDPRRPGGAPPHRGRGGVIDGDYQDLTPGDDDTGEGGAGEDGEPPQRRIGR
ncbi:MAG: FxsA family protein [Kiloniellaceae bacterium]